MFGEDSPTEDVSAFYRNLQQAAISVNPQSLSDAMAGGQDGEDSLSRRTPTPPDPRSSFPSSVGNRVAEQEILQVLGVENAVGVVMEVNANFGRLLTPLNLDRPWLLIYFDRDTLLDGRANAAADLSVVVPVGQEVDITFSLPRGFEQSSGDRTIAVHCEGVVVSRRRAADANLDAAEPVELAAVVSVNGERTAATAITSKQERVYVIRQSETRIADVGKVANRDCGAASSVVVPNAAAAHKEDILITGRTVRLRSVPTPHWVSERLHKAKGLLQRLAIQVYPYGTVKTGLGYIACYLNEHSGLLKTRASSPESIYFLTRSLARASGAAQPLPPVNTWFAFEACEELPGRQFALRAFNLSAVDQEDMPEAQLAEAEPDLISELPVQQQASSSDLSSMDGGLEQSAASSDEAPSVECQPPPADSATGLSKARARSYLAQRLCLSDDSDVDADDGAGDAPRPTPPTVASASAVLAPFEAAPPATDPVDAAARVKMEAPDDDAPIFVDCATDLASIVGLHRAPPPSAAQPATPVIRGEPIIGLQIKSEPLIDVSDVDLLGDQPPAQATSSTFVGASAVLLDMPTPGLPSPVLAEDNDCSIVGATGGSLMADLSRDSVFGSFFGKLLAKTPRRQQQPLQSASSASPDNSVYVTPSSGTSPRRSPAAALPLKLEMPFASQGADRQLEDGQTCGDEMPMQPTPPKAHVLMCTASGQPVLVDAHTAGRLSHAATAAAVEQRTASSEAVSKPSHVVAVTVTVKEEPMSPAISTSGASDGAAVDSDGSTALQLIADLGQPPQQDALGWVSDTGREQLFNFFFSQ